MFERRRRRKDRRDKDVVIYAKPQRDGCPMTPERWRQIEELYHAARERAPADRAALLAEAEPELRREVEALLAQDASGKILDRPPSDLLDDLVIDSRLTKVAVGSQLGPFQIEALLGAGGMGQVFQAVDTRL